MNKAEDRLILTCSIMIVIIAIITMIHCIIDSQKTPINELTFYEYTIDYDDDKEEYDVFADNKHWFIPEDRTEIKYITDESYIIIQQHKKQKYSLIIFINLKPMR